MILSNRRCRDALPSQVPASSARPLSRPFSEAKLLLNYIDSYLRKDYISCFEKGATSWSFAATLRRSELPLGLRWRKPRVGAAEMAEMSKNLKVDLHVQAMPAHRAPSRRPKRGALTALTAPTPAAQLTPQTSEPPQTSCHCGGRASQARELGFGIVERRAQPAEQLVDLLLLDDQRRGDDGLVAG